MLDPHFCPTKISIYIIIFAQQGDFLAQRQHLEHLDSV